MPDLPRLFARRAALLHELAGLEEELGRAVGEALSPADGPDETLSLEAAAAFMGEPVETYRKRLDCRRALISRPGERRLRYSVASSSGSGRTGSHRMRSAGELRAE
jgi:hypothetical protein